MAISDLSVFISADQDVQLNKKESAKGNETTDKESTDSDFFSQLQSANNAVETPVKVTQVSTESIPSNNSIENKAVTDDDASIEPAISGDAMLAQITAANNMDTSVKSSIATNSAFTAQLGDYSEEKIDPNKLVGINTPRPIDRVTPIIDTPLEADEQLVEQPLKPTLPTEKTVLAEAIDKQLQIKGNTPPGDAVTPIVDDVQLVEDIPLNKVIVQEHTAQQSSVSVDTVQAKDVTVNTGVATTDQSENVKSNTDTTQTAIQSSQVKTDTALTAGAEAIKATVTTGSTIVDDRLSAMANDTSKGEVADSGLVEKTVKTSQSSSVNGLDIEVSKSNEGQAKPLNSVALDQTTKVLLSSQPPAQKNIDPLLASLSPEQRQQLQNQVEAIRLQGATSTNITDLKQSLSEFVELNSKVEVKPAGSVVATTSTTTELAQLSKDIALLSTEQKHVLSEQLQKFIATEQPKGALLAKINTVIGELGQTNSTAKSPDGKSQIIAQATSSNTSANALNVSDDVSDKVTSQQALIATPNKSAVLSSIQVDNKPYVAQEPQVKAVNQEQLIKQNTQETAVKAELLTENNKVEPNQLRETSITRVNQLFGQITGLTAGLGATSVTERSDQNYQQALADMQVMHAQQSSPIAQTKQVNLDPTVLQALNIVKSDAAKLLQERVSALLSINNKEAEIRLDPPEMGSMQIRIRSDAEQAHINFVVQNQQAKEALEQSLPRLRELLAQQGIELGESNIQQGNSQSEHGADGQQNGQSQMANQQQNEDQNAGSQQSTIATAQQSSSSIDYYA